MALYPDLNLYPSETLYPEAPGRKPVYLVPALRQEMVAESHKVAVLVEVLEDGEPIYTLVGEALDGAEVPRLGQGATVGGSVTISAGASSRSRMSLNLVDDGSGDLIVKGPDSLLAPYGRELRISRGIERADRIDLVRLGVMRVDRATSSSDGVTTVDGLDRSGRLSEARLEEPFEVEEGTEAAQAIHEVLDVIGYTGPRNFMETTAPLPWVAAEEGDDGWAFAQGIAQAIGGELYFNREGVATLRPIPVAMGTPAAEISEGPGGVLLSADRAWDRGLVYNKVIATGENPLNPDSPPRAEVVDDNPHSPTFWDGPFGKKPYRWQSPYITTQVQAEDAAKGLLNRVIGAPDIISFEAVPNPGLDPSLVIEIHREQLGVERELHVLDEVTIPLDPDGRLSGQTRAVSAV